MKGTLNYQGNVLLFTTSVFNHWTKQNEYLVVYAGEAVWVKEAEVSDVVYIIGKAA